MTVATLPSSTLTSLLLYLLLPSPATDAPPPLSLLTLPQTAPPSRACHPTADALLAPLNPVAAGRQVEGGVGSGEEGHLWQGGGVCSRGRGNGAEEAVAWQGWQLDGVGQHGEI